MDVEAVVGTIAEIAIQHFEIAERLADMAVVRRAGDDAAFVVLRRADVDADELRIFLLSSDQRRMAGRREDVDVLQRQMAVVGHVRTIHVIIVMLQTVDLADFEAVRRVFDAHDVAADPFEIWYIAAFEHLQGALHVAFVADGFHGGIPWRQKRHARILRGIVFVVDEFEIVALICRRNDFHKTRQRLALPVPVEFHVFHDDAVAAVDEHAAIAFAVADEPRAFSVQRKVLDIRDFDGIIVVEATIVSGSKFQDGRLVFAAVGDRLVDGREIVVVIRGETEIRRFHNRAARLARTFHIELLRAFRQVAVVSRKRFTASWKELVSRHFEHFEIRHGELDAVVGMELERIVRVFACRESHFLHLCAVAFADGFRQRVFGRIPNRTRAAKYLQHGLFGAAGLDFQS